MAARVAAMAGEARSHYQRALELPGWRLPHWPRGIAVGGMGGSGVAGLLLQALMQPVSPVPVVSLRGLQLPEWVADGWLLVACSYSGATRETLHLVEQARARGIGWRASASGGELLRSGSSGAACLALDPGHPPRSMSLACTAGLLGLFADLVPELRGWMDEALAGLEQDLAGWRLDRDAGTPPATPDSGRSGRWPVLAREPATIARALQDRFPILYARGAAGEVVAYRWMCQLAENAKAASHCHRFPELLHNEVVAWEAWARLHPRPLVVRIDVEEDGEEAPPDGHDLWDHAWPEITRAGLEARRLRAAGGSAVERVFRQVALGDAASVALARLKGVAATPVPPIERLKQRD